MSELSVGSLSGLAANSYVIDVASGSQLTQPGMIIEVKHALFTGTQTASVAAGADVAVTDLSITHEVSDASNKLIISAFFGISANGQGRGQVGLAVHDGTGFIGVGDAGAGDQPRVSAGGRIAATSSNSIVAMPSVTFVHTPGAGSKTYTVRAFNLRGETNTLYINRTELDSNQEESARGVSSLVIQEVAV